MKTRISIYGIAVAIMLMTACSSTEKGSAENKSDSVTTNNLTTTPGDSIASAVKVDSSVVMKARRYLQETYKQDIEKSIIDDNSRRFRIATVDLNGDNSEEIFIGHTGGYFCGSGGCTIVLLDNSSKTITKFTVTEYPIIIDKTKHNGWSDLLLLSKSKYHVVTYNGKSYPSNPSVLPESSKTSEADQKRLFEDSDATWYTF